MQERDPVPFSLCRPGTRLEFKVSSFETTYGVVKALSVYGARNYLVRLSEYTDREGVVHGSFDPVTKSDRTINLSHATRIVAHGKGELVFESELQYGHLRAREELAEWRASGVIRRRGRRLVIDGRVAYAPNVVRALLMDYLHDNGPRLGVLPWEMLDGQKALQDLTDLGICRYAYDFTSRLFREGFPVGAELDTERMRRHFRRSINRYKLDLRAEEKARHEEDERYYREEMERDERTERRFAGRCADDDFDDIDEDDRGRREDVFAD